MSSYPTHSLNYQRPILPSHPSRWIPLAKAISVIAMVAGVLLIARSTSSLISYAGYQFKLPRQFWVFGIIALLSAILLIVGGLLVLLNLQAGRILLIVAFAWYSYSTVRMFINIRTNARFQPTDQVDTLLNYGACLIFYLILACIVLLRRGLFPKKRTEWK